MIERSHFWGSFQFHSFFQNCFAHLRSMRRIIFKPTNDKTTLMQTCTFSCILPSHPMWQEKRGFNSSSSTVAFLCLPVCLLVALRWESRIRKTPLLLLFLSDRGKHASSWIVSVCKRIEVTAEWKWLRNTDSEKASGDFIPACLISTETSGSAKRLWLWGVDVRIESAL